MIFTTLILKKLKGKLTQIKNLKIDMKQLKVN